MMVLLKSDFAVQDYCSTRIDTGVRVVFLQNMGYDGLLALVEGGRTGFKLPPVEEFVFLKKYVVPP